MVDQHKYTTDDEDGICELHHREASQVQAVYNVRGDTEEGEEVREAVEEGEEDLKGDDGVYHARKDLSSEDGVLFDELGEVV